MVLECLSPTNKISYRLQEAKKEQTRIVPEIQGRKEEVERLNAREREREKEREREGGGGGRFQKYT